LLVSGDLGIGLGKGKNKLTSVQREKKRQKRHRYRERKRLERKAERMERMEKASESSNSIDTIETDTKISFRHKKLGKKDKPKLKVASENEDSKLKEIEPHDSSLPQCSDVNSAKPQTNSEEVSSSSCSNETEELPKLRVSTASYAENTTSGDDPSSADDTNMFPTSESVVDTDTQHHTKVTKTVEADLLPSISSSGVTTATKTHTDA